MAKNEKKEKSEQEIQDKKIHLSRKHYITIGSLIVFLSAVISFAYQGAKYFFNKEIKELNNTYEFEKKLLNKDIKELKKKLSIAQSENLSLIEKLNNLEKEYSEVVKDAEKILLLAPTNGANLLGDHVKFRWDYKKHDSYQKYILEVQHIAGENNEKLEIKINVANPEYKIEHYLIKPNSYGRYIWRIKAGHLAGELEHFQGDQSDYNSFCIYPSVIERIKAKKEIIVGTSQTFYAGYLENKDDIKAGLKGFDCDLIQWVTNVITKKLNLEYDLKVRILYLPWDDLLPDLQQQEIDVVISGMTSTKEREDKNRGIKFTKGYFKCHQILISPQKETFTDFHKDLKGKIIGVIKNTISQIVANDLLSEKFRFKVVSKYRTYSDLYSDLNNNMIDLALVDNVMVNNFLNDKFYQFGPTFDKYLKNFYKEKFGRASEEYAMAVYDDGSKNENLLYLINEILLSKEGKQKLKELNKSWFPKK